MRRKYRSRPPLSGAFGFPLGFVAGIAAVSIAVVAGATGSPGVSVALLAAAVTGVAVVSTPAAALGTALLCWCLHDGFVLGRRGELVLTSLSGQAAVVLLSTAVIVALITAAARLLLNSTAWTAVAWIGAVVSGTGAAANVVGGVVALFSRWRSIRARCGR